MVRADNVAPRGRLRGFDDLPIQDPPPLRAATLRFLCKQGARAAANRDDRRRYAAGDLPLCHTEFLSDG
jgi:hypothetical protein